jgi:two-component system CheB/CheR fusion protein
MIRQAITHTRDLAHGLSPTELEANGLVGALQQLADRTRSMFHVTCNFRRQGLVEFTGSEFGIHLYRIAQEAISNAVKHGKARRVRINLALTKKALVLSITDNGSGLPPGAGKSRGMGLRVMQYRAGVIGGTLEFHRNRNGGTTVTCSVNNALIKPEAKSYDESNQIPDNSHIAAAGVHR